MSTISKLSTKTQRTLTNLDIMNVQGDVSGSFKNFKTTLAKLKEFLYNTFLSDSNVWTGDNDFTGSNVTVQTATAANNPVTKTQHDTKQDEISATVGKVIYNDGTITGSGFFGLNETDGALNIAAINVPASSSDTMGNIGDVIIANDTVFAKSAAGWRSVRLNSF